MRFNSVSEWLQWQEGLNPRGIELGLDRCRPVARAMRLTPLPFPLVSVAGTNGKGSCVAILESVLSHGGYRVGGYTSPHLRRFNETVRVCAEPVDDAALLRAFNAVDTARGDIALTWFEFRTLAAVHLLLTARPDLAVLEVGLGGRLDAVNLFDADVAVVTSVGIDHTDWLGDNRDDIGREKAGIFRPGRPAVCGDPAPPAGLLEAADATGARLYRAGQDFHWAPAQDGWVWTGPAAEYPALPLPGIPGAPQLHNAAAALMALECLKDRFPLDRQVIAEGLSACRLPGRQEISPGPPEIIRDVAHNPDAARALAAALRGRACTGATRAVFGMYRDKDSVGVVREMLQEVDAWHLASLSKPRGAPAESLADSVAAAGAVAPVSIHSRVGDAFAAARRDSQPTDRIVVFGSFETVRESLDLET